MLRLPLALIAVPVFRASGSMPGPGRDSRPTTSHWGLWLVLATLAIVGVMCAGGFVGVLWIHDRMIVARRSPAVQLIYEVDNESLPAGMTVDMSKVVAVLERRVVAGGEHLAQVRQVDERRVEVGVYGGDQAAVDRVERLVESAGTLEFRVLCNSVDHADIIKQTQETGQRTVYDAQQQRLAWWVPVVRGQESDFAGPEWSGESAGEGPGRIRWRAVEGGPGARSIEVLVVQDPCNVDGRYLSDASAGFDLRGRPCVEFAFDSRGALLFENLTGSNLPDDMSAFRRRLGVILNGQVYSAPNIESAISDRGEITGSFTLQDVENFVAVFNAGALPVPLKQVSMPAPTRQD